MEGRLFFESLVNQPDASSYLRTRVMTASPEQLRLMLFEGAIKFCRQGRDHLGRKDYEGMFNALVRAQKIVLELTNSLRPEVDPELCERLGSLYTYIYRRLVDATTERDIEAIDESIRLIDYERETWVLLMNKLQAEREAGTDPVAEAQATLPAQRPPADNPIASIGPQSVEDGRDRFSAEG